MYDTCEVIVIATDREWLVDLTRQLIDNGLVACAHTMPIRSIYLSQGEAHDHTQARAELHTRRGNVISIIEHVHRDHPGGFLSVIAVPITDGDPVYLQWVRNHTKTKQQPHPGLPC